MRTLLTTTTTTATAAAALIVLVTPSAATPDRSTTLSRDARHAAWTSEVRVGPYLGEPTTCDEPVLGCDETLIRLTNSGDLTVTAEQTLAATRAADAGFVIDLYRSDAKGRVGTPIKVSRRTSATSDTVSARRLPPGFYLAEVKWYDLTVGDYAGSATLAPTRRR